jgi:hypothetical protein
MQHTSIIGVPKLIGSISFPLRGSVNHRIQFLNRWAMWMSTSVKKIRTSTVIDSHTSSTQHSNKLKISLLPAGPTQSCFSEFQKFGTDGCTRRVEEDDGSYTQEAISEIKDMDFCVSGPTYGPAKQGKLRFVMTNHKFHQSCYFTFRSDESLFKIYDWQTMNHDWYRMMMYSNTALPAAICGSATGWGSTDFSSGRDDCWSFYVPVVATAAVSAAVTSAASAVCKSGCGMHLQLPCIDCIRLRIAKITKDTA